MKALDRVDRGLLLDLYGSLLTDRQREIWHLYYLEDWSLAEISEFKGISRAAVYDVLERTERALADYELRLGLLAAWQSRRQVLAELVAAVAALPPDTPGLSRIRPLVRRLAEEEGLSDV